LIGPPLSVAPATVVGLASAAGAVVAAPLSCAVADAAPSSSSSSPQAASNSAPTASRAIGARRVNDFRMYVSFQGFTLGAILP
jgi:hypothetical protein